MASQTQQSVSLGGTIKRQETINFSSARTTFSFGKEKRFPSVRKPQTHAIYEAPSSLKKQQIGFGIGNRFKGQEHIRERSSSPPPTHYTLASDFDTGKPGTASSQQKGGVYSFGIGRQYFQRVYLPHQKSNLDKSMPGPGHYESVIYGVGTDSKKYNMQGKTYNPSEPSNIEIKKNIPGPGTYGDVIEINKYGVYNVSTIENTKAAAWSPSKKRFGEFENEIRHRNAIPPPGTYDPTDYSGGKYLLSSFKNYGTRKMMPDQCRNDLRKRKIMSETPGPGSYMAPSEFGHLESYKMQMAKTAMNNSPRNFNRTAQTAQGTERPQIGDGIRYRRKSNNPMHNTINGGSPGLEGATVHEYMKLRNRRGSSTMGNKQQRRGQRMTIDHGYRPILQDTINERDENGQSQQIEFGNAQKRHMTAGDPMSQM